MSLHIIWIDHIIWENCDYVRLPYLYHTPIYTVLTYPYYTIPAGGAGRGVSGGEARESHGGRVA